VGNKQNRLIRHLAKHGIAATAIQNTGGTQCGCMTFRPGVANYSAEWHELNPTEPTCNNGYLNDTETQTEILALFQTDLQSVTTLTNENLKETIGELTKDDLVMFGQIKSSDYTFFDISGFVESRDYITFNSNNYLVRITRNINFDVLIGQVSLLIKIE